VRVLLLGATGKVGSALAPRLAEAGHDVTPASRGDAWDPAGHDAAVDFTEPAAVRGNVERCLAVGVRTVVGTTGVGPPLVRNTGRRASSCRTSRSAPS